MNNAKILGAGMSVALKLGAKFERNRIITLLEEHPLSIDATDSPVCWHCNDAEEWDKHIVALIKGETE